MHIELQQISQIISAVCDPSCSDQVLNQFARLCLKIAIVHLQVHEAQGRRIRETDEKNELEGIASDCIADLFARDEKGNLLQLQKYFNSRYIKEQPADELYILLRRLITRKVRQHLTRLYAQRDPEGGKLIRNVRLAVQRIETLSIKKDITGEYIFSQNKDSESSTIYRPNYEELNHAFSRLFLAKHSVDTLVHQVLSKLSENLKCHVEVLILDFVKLVRVYRSAIERKEEIVSDYDPLNFQWDIELKKKVYKIIEGVNKKISQKYIEKNKLTLDEGIAIINALREMSGDALNGRRLQENFYYLQKYLPALTREEYYHSLRKIFEYFVRLFKDGIRKIVTDNSD